MRHHPRPHVALTRPMTAFAVTVLLTACGGGGDGSDRKVSSSPSPNAQNGLSSNVTLNINAGTGAIANAITSGQGPDSNAPSAPLTPGTVDVPDLPTPTAPPIDNAQNNNTPDPGADTTPTTSTEPVAPGVTPLISNDGIRGDVLVAMFDQKACQGEFNVQRVESLDGPRLTPDSAIKNDTPPVQIEASLNIEPYTYDMDKWKIDGRHMPARAPGYIFQCLYPDIRSYSNPLKPGDYTYSMITAGRYHTYLTTHFYNTPWITKGVNEAKVDYPLTVTEDQVIVGGKVNLRLDEDFGYTAKNISDHATKQGRKVETLLISTARSYQRQTLVPFGALNQWQDTDGNNLQLLLIKADKANTVRLCTHLNSTLAKRLHCVTWEVPTDWAWGKELKGGKHYLIDDRSVYANETGFMFWGNPPL